MKRVVCQRKQAQTKTLDIPLYSAHEKTDFKVWCHHNMEAKHGSTLGFQF